MKERNDVLSSLLGGLPDNDQVDVLESIRDAQDDQLERKRHPRRRRHRDADGKLVPPPRD